jgi:hypothetical protein
VAALLLLLLLLLLPLLVLHAGWVLAPPAVQLLVTQLLALQLPLHQTLVVLAS